MSRYFLTTALVVGGSRHRRIIRHVEWRVPYLRESVAWMAASRLAHGKGWSPERVAELARTRTGTVVDFGSRIVVVEERHCPRHHMARDRWTNLTMCTECGARMDASVTAPESEPHRHWDDIPEWFTENPHRLVTDFDWSRF